MKKLQNFELFYEYMDSYKDIHKAIKRRTIKKRARQGR